MDIPKMKSICPIFRNILDMRINCMLGKTPIAHLILISFDINQLEFRVFILITMNPNINEAIHLLHMISS